MTSSIEDIARQAEAAWQLGMQNEQAGRMEAAHAKRLGGTICAR